jgi:hypothetical protein
MRNLFSFRPSINPPNAGALSVLIRVYLRNLRFKLILSPDVGSDGLTNEVNCGYNFNCI